MDRICACPRVHDTENGGSSANGMQKDGPSDPSSLIKLYHVFLRKPSFAGIRHQGSLRALTPILIASRLQPVFLHYSGFTSNENAISPSPLMWYGGCTSAPQELMPPTPRTAPQTHSTVRRSGGSSSWCVAFSSSSAV